MHQNASLMLLYAGVGPSINYAHKQEGGGAASGYSQMSTIKKGVKSSKFFQQSLWLPIWSNISIFFDNQ